MKLQELAKKSQIVLSVVGPKGSGKTCLCKNLQKKYGGEVVSFASVLRQIVMKAFELTEEDVGKLKDEPMHIPRQMRPKFFRRLVKEIQVRLESAGDKTFDWRKVAINKFAAPMFTTPRQIMQWVGTDFILELCPEFHCILLGMQMTKNGLYFVDDCRFIDEYNALHGAFDNLCVIKIRKRNEIDKSEVEHSSEAEWDDITHDHEIKNDGSLGAYYKGGEALYKKFLASIASDIKIDKGNDIPLEFDEKETPEDDTPALIKILANVDEPSLEVPSDTISTKIGKFIRRSARPSDKK